MVDNQSHSSNDYSACHYITYCSNVCYRKKISAIPYFIIFSQLTLLNIYFNIFWHKHLVLFSVLIVLYDQSLKYSFSQSHLTRINFSVSHQTITYLDLLNITGQSQKVSTDWSQTWSPGFLKYSWLFQGSLCHLSGLPYRNIHCELIDEFLRNIQHLELALSFLICCYRANTEEILSGLVPVITDLNLRER